VQHGFPLPPQLPQAPLMQVSPGALHALAPAQHGPPLAPHGAHLFAAQTVAAAVQSVPPQQAWFVPPHAVHCMF
jgi:hypothetical protein